MPRGGNHHVAQAEFRSVSGGQKTYPKDFKQTAIDIALIGDRPMSHIAKELGINDNTLYNWVGT